MCETQIRMADLNAVIRDFERLFRSVTGEKVPLRISLDPRLGHVQCDPVKVGSLVVNLLMQARDVSPSGGEIAIATLNADLDEDTAGGIQLPSGAYVIMEIVVKGRMDAPEKVREIVAEANGAVSIRAVGTQGSSVTVVLPRIATGSASPA